MRLDSHQHFWQYNSNDYPWITEQMDVLRKDYLPQHLEPLLAAIGFDGAIAVQARQTIEETKWLLQLADANSIVKGVVGWVDLLSPILDQQLEAIGTHPKLVGVRHVVQDEPNDRFILLPEFRLGIRQLRKFDLAYDLLVFPRHLRAAAELVREFPDQRFVLDHIGKPAIRDGRISPWREDLQDLAEFPNVYCKLSGMVTEAKWNLWQAADFRRYLTTVVECFGPDRLMIGSDWPVCTLAGDYRATMSIVMDFIGNLPPATQEGILGDNCARFYGITC